MKVRVSRSGGFAGLTRTWEAEIDDSLLQSLPWDRRPRASASADRYVYVIRISRRRITLPEQYLDGPWRELVDRVTTGTPTE
ncbi:hypothetical protein BH11ACT2_BH11ACT2_05090 [soil metagenome]